MTDIKVGDKVRKIKGYKFEGIVVSRFVDLYGVDHCDVQVPGEKGVDSFAGMIHVFLTDQIEVYN